MKFGKTTTISEKAAFAERRLGKTTGASKGSKPAPAPKIKPTIGKDKIGAKAIWKF